MTRFIFLIFFRSNIDFEAVYFMYCVYKKDFSRWRLQYSGVDEQQARTVYNMCLGRKQLCYIGRIVETNDTRYSLGTDGYYYYDDWHIPNKISIPSWD